MIEKLIKTDDGSETGFLPGPLSFYQKEGFKIDEQVLRDTIREV